jgi:hypothetical protein
MRRFIAVRAIAAAVLLLSCLCGAQPAESPSALRTPWSITPTIVIIAASESDPRIPLAHEAIAFWNETLAGLGSPFRLGAVTVLKGRVPSDQLSAISYRVLTRTGPGEVPESVRNGPGDLFIALSDGDFVSFAMRWPSERKALVGIRSANMPPLMIDRVMRILIAHELGHAIGLGHNSDIKLLMCGRPAPCAPDAYRFGDGRFLPLAEAEKSELRRMYPPEWKSERP